MKIKLITLILLFSFLFLITTPTSLQAQTTTPSNNRVRKENPVNQKDKNIAQRQEGGRQEFQVSDKRKVMLEKTLKRIVAKLQATIQRLTNLSERIASRLEKLKELRPEIDTTNIETSLGEANDLIAEASGKLTSFNDALPAKLAEAFAGDNTKLIFDELKDELKGIRTLLREAHTTLTKVIGEIKGLAWGADRTQ